MNMASQHNAAFTEIQGFSQRWFWVGFTLSMLLLVGIFAYGMIEQLVFGRPWGDRPVSDLTLALVGSAVLLFSGGMTWLFYSLRLITEVRDDILYIYFYPVYKKRIPYDDIAFCQARSYRPLLEYGGWGIKYGRSGWACNIAGNRGVQLVLNNGKHILIGSQRADELAAAINARLAGI